MREVGPVAQSVLRLTTGWTVRWSIPGGGEIFRTCPERPWCPTSLLYNRYRVFPECKVRPGRDPDPSPLLLPRSKIEVSYTSALPKGLRGLWQRETYLRMRERFVQVLCYYSQFDRHLPGLVKSDRHNSAGVCSADSVCRATLALPAVSQCLSITEWSLNRLFSGTSM